MENNTSFCYAPWNHLYINPDSKLMPCCIYTDRNEEFADLNEMKAWRIEPNDVNK